MEQDQENRADWNNFRTKLLNSRFCNVSSRNESNNIPAGGDMAIAMSGRKNCKLFVLKM